MQSFLLNHVFLHKRTFSCIVEGGGGRGSIVPPPPHNDFSVFWYVLKLSVQVNQRMTSVSFLLVHFIASPPPPIPQKTGYAIWLQFLDSIKIKQIIICHLMREELSVHAAWTFSLLRLLYTLMPFSKFLSKNSSETCSNCIKFRNPIFSPSHTLWNPSQTQNPWV